MRQVLAALFILVGAGLSIWGVTTILEARRSSGWPTAEGVVLSSKVGTGGDSQSTSYRARVVYEYKVDERRYASREVSFGDYGSSDRSHAASVVRRYPKGKPVTVYFNPENPDVAVLEVGLSWSCFMLFVVGLLFLSAGVLFFLQSTSRLEG